MKAIHRKEKYLQSTYLTQRTNTHKEKKNNSSTGKRGTGAFCSSTTWKAEAGELLESRSSRAAWATLRPHLKKKKR